MTESAIFFSARPRAHGSEHQRMSCHFRAWLVLAVLLLPGALSAQVPAIADIPDDLPAKLRLPLAQTRASLVERRDQLKGRVSEQYDKCSAVPEGSPQEQPCRVSKAELQTAIGVYAAEVRKFNADVAVANCAQRANAEAVYSDLKQRIQTDQQIIHNFGFEQRADEIQAWADLGEQARESYEKKARVILIDVTLAGVVAGLQDGVSAAPPISQELGTRLVRMFTSAGLPKDDVAFQIARKVGKALTPEQADILAGRIGNVKDAYEKTTDLKDLADSQGGLELARSVAAVAGWRYPHFALLAHDIDTVSLAVYAAQYEKAKYQINKLTQLTETQLKELDDATKRLKSDVAQLHDVVETLKSLPSCDSTTLVRQ